MLSEQPPIGKVFRQAGTTDGTAGATGAAEDGAAGTTVSGAVGAAEVGAEGACVAGADGGTEPYG